MEIRFQSIFWKAAFFFIGYFALLGCSRSSGSSQDSELIAFLLQDQPGLQNACENFVRTENFCVVSGSNVALSCNGTLQTRLRNRIQPEDRRSDDILEAYFRCFDACNREFNVFSQCQDLPYSTNDSYRTNQRVLGNTEPTSRVGTASIQWNNCFDGCRSIGGKQPPENSSLRGSGTTFPEDWFEAIR